jgi:hypothetical protein
MPLLNYLEQSEYQAALGMDTTSPLMNVQPGFVRSAYNCNLGLISGWIKRDGYSVVNSTSWGSLSITAGTEFRKSNGDLLTILFGKSTGGTSGKIGSVAAGGTSVSDILTGLSDAVRPAFVQFKDRLFMYNGSDNGVLYDGTGTRQIGITAPVAISSIVDGSGGNLGPGNYVYAYTYYNANTKAESSPSPVTVIEGVSADSSLDLTLTAGSATTATHIRIWRTVANGNQLFYEGENTISDTTFSSTISDEELGRPLELDNSRLSDVTTSKGKFPIVAQSRVFVCTGRNEVRYSALGFDGSMPETFQVKAVVDTTGTYGDGDDIVGLGNVGELPVVIKRRSIGILQPLDLPSFNSEVDTQGYRYIEISDNVGGVSHWAGGQVEGEYVFAGRDSIYATNGQSVRKAGVRTPDGQWMCPIEATIRSLGWTATQVPNVSFGNDIKFKRFYIQVFADNNDTAPKYTLVGDYQQYPNIRYTMYVPGSNETTHPGIQAGCFVNVTNSSDGSSDMWFGNTSGNGKVYKMNTGTADVDKGISFSITTRPLDLGQPNHTKLFKTFRAQVQGDGTDYSLSMAPLYDMSGQALSSDEYSLIGPGAQWDVAQWDTGRFLDDSTVQARYDGHRKARFIQMVLSQTAASAPVTIFGWSPSGSLFQH